MAFQKKKPVKKPLTFAQILHIAEVYSKVNHKYLHYGDVVKLVEANAEHCVCCGATIPEGRQICPRCDRMCKWHGWVAFIISIVNLILLILYLIDVF